MALEGKWIAVIIAVIVIVVIIIIGIVVAVVVGRRSSPTQKKVILIGMTKDITGQLICYTTGSNTYVQLLELKEGTPTITNLSTQTWYLTQAGSNYTLRSAVTNLYIGINSSTIMTSSSPLTINLSENGNTVLITDTTDTYFLAQGPQSTSCIGMGDSCYSVAVTKDRTMAVAFTMMT